MKENQGKTKKAVKPIPDGFRTVTPFLIVSNADSFMTFIENAFSGKVTSRMDAEGKVMHATMTIGDSTIMLAEADKYEPTQTMLHLYVEDADKIYKQALKAGCESLREMTDEFYGDRSGGVKDEWGNQWWIATHTEDVNEEEMQKRMEEFSKQEV